MISKSFWAWEYLYLYHRWVESRCGDLTNVEQRSGSCEHAGNIKNRHTQNRVRVECAVGEAEGCWSRWSVLSKQSAKHCMCSPHLTLRSCLLLTLVVGKATGLLLGRGWWRRWKRTGNGEIASCQAACPQLLQETETRDRGEPRACGHQWAPVGGRLGRQLRCVGLSNRNGCNSPKNFLRPAPWDKGYQRMSRGMKQRFPVGDVSGV